MTTVGQGVAALERIAKALERIAAAAEGKPDYSAQLDEYEEILNRAIRAIESTHASYNTAEVQLSIAWMEYKRLGFESPEALLKAWRER